MGFFDAISGTTTTLKSIPAFGEQVNILLKNPLGIFILALFVPVYIAVKNFKPIFSYFESRKSKKISSLASYVKELEFEKGIVYEELKDKRDMQYFEIATGIRAENKFRQVLVALHLKTPPSITWTIVRRAVEYIEVDNAGNVSIRNRTKFEVAFHWFNLLSSIFIALYGIFIAFLLLHSEKGAISIIAALVISFLFFATSLYILSQNWPWFAAERISNFISHKENAKSI